MRIIKINNYYENIIYLLLYKKNNYHFYFLTIY